MKTLSITTASPRGRYRRGKVIGRRRPAYLRLYRSDPQMAGSRNMVWNAMLRWSDYAVKALIDRSSTQRRLFPCDRRRRRAKLILMPKARPRWAIAALPPM